MNAPMSLTDASRDRYSSLDFLSIYLAAEWQDILFPEADPGTKQDGNIVGGKPGYFYREVARLVLAWMQAAEMKPNRICDIGGSTGRMIYELALRFPAATDLVLAEPSSQFCEWAHRLLKGREFDGWMPIPQHSGQPDFKYVPAERLPTAINQVHIHNILAEAIPRPQSYFDLITCLNVIDRIEDPPGIIKTITKLLKPGGMLILASPLNFEEKFTPKDKWVTDLQELLDQNVWEIGERHTDVNYSFSYYNRHAVRFRSQVIGARKK